MRIMWDDILHVFEGDEVEILRGVKMWEGFYAELRATTLRNITRGGVFKSSTEGVILTNPTQDLDPPIRGYVNNLEISTPTFFDLVEKSSPFIGSIIRDSASFLDSHLYKRCKDKDYHDIVTNAFIVLEERIRSKVGVDSSYTGKKLIDYSFSPQKGKLTLGDTASEKESFYMLFRGAIGFLRNPAAHRFISTEDDAEILEIIYFVNMLLRMIEKAHVL